MSKLISSICMILLVAHTLGMCHAFLIFDPSHPDSINRNIQATIEAQAKMSAFLANSACSLCQNATLVVGSQFLKNSPVLLSNDKDGAESHISLLRSNTTSNVPSSWSWLFVTDDGSAALLATYDIAVRDFFPLGSSVAHFSSSDSNLPTNAIKKLISEDKLIYFRSGLTSSSNWIKILEQNVRMRRKYSNRYSMTNNSQMQLVYQDNKASCNCNDFAAEVNNSLNKRLNA